MHPDPLCSGILSFCKPLIPHGSHLLVAVSGGADSVALFHILRQLKGALGIGRLDVAHVNHGLRGAASDEDEQFVREMSRSAGVQCFVHRLAGRTVEDPGVEEWGRTGRYAFLMDVKAKHGYSLVATGHTADDQAETVLMRLMRGTGMRGLTGIQALREDGVVRPLLEMRKGELVEWLSAKGIGHREDESNRNARYQRNWIRQEILARIDRADGGAVGRIAHVALEAQEEWKDLVSQINKWVSRHVVNRGVAGFLVDCDAFGDPALAGEAIAELLRQREVPFSRSHIRAIHHLAHAGRGVALLAEGWVAEAGEGRVSVTPGSQREKAGPFQYRVLVPGTTQCPNGVRFTAEYLAAPVGRVEFDAENLTALLDANRCGENLVFRSFGDEERFEPYGAEGVRRVRDFLRKQGVPLSVRNATGVVAQVKGSIVWIPGVRVDRRFCISTRTERILKIACGFGTQ